jgi:fibronectin type 3 domain-containing protein
MKRIAALLALVFAFGASMAHAQYTVRISWTASVDAAANPSLTYNVYRAPTCGGPFLKINAAPVTSTMYLDANAATGAAYCYQVTSVLGGVSSVPSNQAIAALPPPSDRRATCEHRGALIGWIRCVASRPKRAAPQTQTP